MAVGRLAIGDKMMYVQERNLRNMDKEDQKQARVQQGL